MVELLARTGMRAGELGALRDDAVFRLSGAHWLRIPVGKLHNDGTSPSTRCSSISSTTTGPGGVPAPRDFWSSATTASPSTVGPSHRYVAAVARRAGTGHVHPHQLRHTLATQ